MISQHESLEAAAALDSLAAAAGALLRALENIRGRGQSSLTVGQAELDMISRSMRRLFERLNALLDFLRLEAGQVEPGYESTHLTAYTVELAGVLRPAVERAGLEFIVDCAPLPEPIYVDWRMWEKIVVNLVSNALSATRRGEIKMRLHWVGVGAELTVADTGIGIPEIELAHVVEPFHRVRGAPSRVGERTGIGLSLVRALVQLHGGELSIDSVEGRGTTVSVFMRAGSAHLPKQHTGRTPRQASVTSFARSYVEGVLQWLASEDRTEDKGPRTESGTETLSSSSVLDPQHSVPGGESSDELEQRVGERIQELSAVNEDLINEIAERKRAEEALRDANDKVEMILDSITDQFFALDDQYRFTYLNRHAADQMKRLGKDPERLIGSVLWDEFPHPPNEAAVRRVISERVPITDELYYPPLAEWVENHMYPTRDGGLVTFQKYVTERKRAEDLMQKLHAQLAQVTRVATMGELAASIAHDINQPLAAILNNSSVALRLLGAPGAEEEMRAVLSDIATDATRACAITARIRALTEPCAPERTSLNINDLVAEVLAFAGSELAELRITARTELPADLPQVSGDRVQLQQVLLNLVINACEAMNEVAEERRIVTIGGRRGELDGLPAVVITVHDLGAGFKPQDAERLFDAFFTTKPRGMGLGLRISRSIVEAHGGRLWAALNDGPGATFFLALPAETETL